MHGWVLLIRGRHVGQNGTVRYRRSEDTSRSMVVSACSGSHADELVQSSFSIVRRPTVAVSTSEKENVGGRWDAVPSRCQCEFIRERRVVTV